MRESMSERGAELSPRETLLRSLEALKGLQVEDVRIEESTVRITFAGGRQLEIDVHQFDTTEGLIDAYDIVSVNDDPETRGE